MTFRIFLGVCAKNNSVTCNIIIHVCMFCVKLGNIFRFSFRAFPPMQLAFVWRAAFPANSHLNFYEKHPSLQSTSYFLGAQFHMYRSQCLEMGNLALNGLQTARKARRYRHTKGGSPLYMEIIHLRGGAFRPKTISLGWRKATRQNKESYVCGQLRFARLKGNVLLYVGQGKCRFQTCINVTL